MGKLFSKLKQYLIVEEWNIAIREKGTELLFELGGTKKPFQVLKNNFRYWAADPFIISYKEKDFLFFEMFDRFKRKGLIGYREIADGKIEKMKLAYEIDKHLSFPFVFYSDGVFYMMPEASESNEIPLLKAVHFPEKWNMYDTVMERGRYVDSALVHTEGKEYLFTQELKSGYRFNTLDIYEKKNDHWISHKMNPVVISAATARLAGKVLTHGGDLIRVAQDCSESYGKKLHFFRIEEISDTAYKETEIAEVCVEDVSIACDTEYNGIHTYNCSERYEVIDLKNTDHISLGNIVYVVYYAFCKLFKKDNR